MNKIRELMEEINKVMKTYEEEIDSLEETITKLKEDMTVQAQVINELTNENDKYKKRLSGLKKLVGELND